MEVHNEAYRARRVVITSPEVEPEELIDLLEDEPEGLNTLYVEIPLVRGDLSQILLERRFNFHCVRNDPLRLVFYRWFSSEQDRVPEPPGSSTGAHLVVWKTIGDRKRFLVFRSNQRKRWELPGGRGHHDETVIETLWREAGEEVGITNDDLITPPSLESVESTVVDDQFGLHHDLSVIFSATVRDDWEPHLDGEEAQEFRWVTVEKVHRSPHRFETMISYLFVD